ncbi:MAG: hypothetical protein AAGJ87_01865 [Pseudomonadota bacterium]
MTGTAPHDEDIAAYIAALNTRLASAFMAAITRAAPNLHEQERKTLGAFLRPTAQDLLSMSRTIVQVSVLHDYVGTPMDIMKRRLSERYKHRSKPNQCIKSYLAGVRREF